MSAGFWTTETTGVLRPVVEKFIKGQELEPDELIIIRAYLRQWMTLDFRGEEAEALRASIEQVNTMEALYAWVEAAEDAGIDPF